LPPEQRSTYLAAEARKHDPDRYLCALFAPAERRDAVLGLILFHHELARVPDIVSQPMAGYIRYQWWRDAVDELCQGKPPRQHPVIAELALALRRQWVSGDALQALIDARELALEQVGGDDLDALERYVASTSGALQALVYTALGGLQPIEAEGAADVGTAYGLTGIVRAVAQEARRTRPVLPPALLAEAGVTPREDDTAGMSEGLDRAVAGILARADGALARGRQRAGRPARALMAAFLPAALAGAYARRIRRLGGDPVRAAEVTRPASAPLELLARSLLRQP
jgi:phytoene synthase